MIDAGVREFRFAARALRRSPAFTAVAVLTFAIGIGMNIAVFSVRSSRLAGQSLPAWRSDSWRRTGPRPFFSSFCIRSIRAIRGCMRQWQSC
jgi:hypothetical protein